MKLKGIVIFGSLMTIGAAGWAMKAGVFKSPPAPTPISKPRVAEKPAIEYDQALLTRFKTACGFLDATKSEYTMSGSIADERGAVASAFFFSKKKNDCYYKLGNTETINSNGKCFYIDHSAKVAILSSQKTVMAPTTATGNMTETLQSEGYHLNGKAAGGNQVISFTNDTHLTCKEYSLTVDTLSLRPQRIYIRYTNEANIDKEADRILDVKLQSISNEAQPEKWPLSNYITNNSGKWSLISKYTTYKLIIQ